MSYIYIIKLQNNKYYIGKTNNPTFRLEQHFQENGSVWTKLHKPISLIKTIKSYSQFDEDKWTLEYIAKYGIDNVRGGSFSHPILSHEEKQVITKMIQSQKDQCYKCGLEGHFIRDCPDIKNDNCEVEQEMDDWEIIDKPKSFFDKLMDAANSTINFLKIVIDGNNKPQPRRGRCYRCRRYGHWASDCDTY